MTGPLHVLGGDRYRDRRRSGRKNLTIDCTLVARAHLTAGERENSGVNATVMARPRRISITMLQEANVR